MHYKIVDYVSNWQDIIIAGTCELCFSTAEYDDGYLVLEDENSQLLQVNLLQLRLDDIYCDNLLELQLSQKRQPKKRRPTPKKQ